VSLNLYQRQNAHKKHVQQQRNRIKSNILFAALLIAILIGGVYQTITIQTDVIQIMDSVSEGLLDSNNINEAKRHLLELGGIDSVDKKRKRFQKKFFVVEDPLTPEQDWLRFPDTVVEE